MGSRVGRLARPGQRRILKEIEKEEHITYDRVLEIVEAEGRGAAAAGSVTSRTPEDYRVGVWILRSWS